ncbi:hypothetical protein PY546_15000 [Providencia stuartii]|nr:hypothetical protein [Providencia stuartii]
MGKRNPPAHIVIELEKNGSGTHMYITYSASYSDTLTPEFVQEIFKTANDVAAGKKEVEQGNEIISVRKAVSGQRYCPGDRRSSAAG